MTETEKTGTIRPHEWERLPRENWKGLKGKLAEKHPDWVDVPFWCGLCECRGHAMWRAVGDDGPPDPPPDFPEEAQNMNTRELVDPRGNCLEQIVETVHAH